MYWGDVAALWRGSAHPNGLNICARLIRALVAPPSSVQYQFSVPPLAIATQAFMAPTSSSQYQFSI